MALVFRSGIIVFALVALGLALLGPAQAVAQTSVSGATSLSVEDSDGQQKNQQLPGSISGTIVDETGAVVTAARVKLTRDDQSQAQEVLSGANGQFSFANVAPGSFHLTIASAGFATQTTSGTLHSGQVQLVPPITLAVATANTEVEVSLTQVQVAEEQVKEEEQQRVLRVIPNFYVSYVPDAMPLNSKQKFKLAWKTIVDPFSFVAVGGVAGVQQAQNNFAGYGQGAQGYAKRYGASYGDLVSGTVIGTAILPSLFKQDPRYFYKGTGTKKSRLLYALANAVICKGDNRRWQPNYSAILGSFAAGGISNLYYPAEDRNGARLTLENGLIGIGTSGAINIFEEFFVRKPRAEHSDRNSAGN